MLATVNYEIIAANRPGQGTMLPIAGKTDAMSRGSPQDAARDAYRHPIFSHLLMIVSFLKAAKGVAVTWAERISDKILCC